MTSQPSSAVRVPDRSTLQSVQRAVAVMHELARTRRPVSIAELATSLQLERTIVHRIVRTLEAEELVEPATGGYTIGPGALLFGYSYLDTLGVRGVALPYMLDLADRVVRGQPWTVALMIRIKNEGVIVEIIYNPSAPLDSHVLPMGHRLPIEKTAAGRALLAYMPHEEIVELIGKTSADELAPELEQVRHDGGVGFLRGVYGDLSAVCATIFDRNGGPAAGLLIGGIDLEAHLTPDSVPARALRRTADAIARVLP